MPISLPNARMNMLEILRCLLPRLAIKDEETPLSKEQVLTAHRLSTASAAMDKILKDCRRSAGKLERKTTRCLLPCGWAASLKTMRILSRTLPHERAPNAISHEQTQSCKLPLEQALSSISQEQILSIEASKKAEGQYHKNVTLLPLDSPHYLIACLAKKHREASELFVV